MNVDEIAPPSSGSFKFEEVGDTVKGELSYAGTSVRKNTFNEKNEKVMHLVIETDEGPQSIYPVLNTNTDGDGYASRMARAIANAVRAAGESELKVGGTIAVRFDESIPTDKGNPAKGYTAQYKAPEEDSGGEVDDMLG